MSIELSPAELGFRRPFQVEVIQTLEIMNTHFEPVAFKVKTTAPKLYCVRPNSGRIEAGEHFEVQVILQAMKEDPPLDFRCRDKFLVQSVAITADRETQNLADIWNGVSKEDVQEKKIRVVFLPPLIPPNVPHGEVVPEPPNLRTPQDLGSYHRPEQKETNSPPSYTESQQASPPVGPVSKQELKPEGTPSTQPTVFHTRTVTLSEFNAQQQALVEARATIELLKQQLQEQDGLRKRLAGGDSNVKTSAGATPMAVAQAAEGVPVKIVAALCLVSFLLALLF